MAITSITRENWDKWSEFFFSVLGSMVGLGNIWRFPYLCYKNGGGAFLVPYFIFLVLGGLPLLFIELSYPQYSNLGPAKAWIMCPLLKGIGYGAVIITSIISIYYAVIISWTLYYLYISMHPVLPWRYCNNAWNNQQCFETTLTMNNNITNMQNETKMDPLTQYNNSNISINSQAVSASEQFWKHHVLEVTSGVDDIGGINYPLLLCLAIAWILVFLGIIKGIKSSGKVAYVTATLPYILLTILLCRSVTLPGSKNGLLYYIVPDWEKLKKFSVWKDAAIQVLYSAGIGGGELATLASYNNFNNNCQRDSIILPIIDGLTSWFAGIITFCVIGYMAHISNTDISNVVTQGPGLAFVVYPEALSTLPLAQLWSTLFFIMLFSVGVDSEFAHVQTTVTALTDIFPTQLGNRKMLVALMVCFINLLLGIVMVTKGGIYVLQIIDWYIASIPILFLAFTETIGVCYIYGFSRFIDDVTMMIGRKPFVIWKPLCKYVAPVIVFVCWIASLVSSHTPLKYDSGKLFPGWVIYLGISIAFIPLMAFPVVALKEILSVSGPFLKRLKTSVTPSPEWGPAIHKYEEAQ